jgi:hypothetical protein
VNIFREGVPNHRRPACRNGSCAAYPLAHPLHPYKHVCSGMSPNFQAAAVIFAASGTPRTLPACPCTHEPKILQHLAQTEWRSPCWPLLFLSCPPPLRPTPLRLPAIAPPQDSWRVSLPQPNLSCGSTTHFPYGSALFPFVRTP